jgi:hypothetical protein
MLKETGGTQMTKEPDRILTREETERLVPPIPDWNSRGGKEIPPHDIRILNEMARTFLERKMKERRTE